MSLEELHAMVELSESESWTLLREAVVGRLAVMIDDQPEIFPVNHLVDLGTVVFRSGAGTKLNGAVGHRVAFEVDGYDLETSSAWSVVVKGSAARLGSDEEIEASGVLSLHSLVPTEKWNYVRITVSSITGRQFRSSHQSRLTPA